nr:MAG TPA: hypothetical protein [Caudoviricetes sp.]
MFVIIITSFFILYIYYITSIFSCQDFFKTFLFWWASHFYYLPSFIFILIITPLWLFVKY